MAARAPRILLGIDYGTTFTGLAWMQTNGQDNPSLDDLKLYKWQPRDAPKVPSAYSYSAPPSTSKCKQWGFDIDINSEVMRWTKLELEPRTSVRELEVLGDLMKGLDLVNELRANPDAGITNDIPRHITRDAEDIVRDYLGKVAREWYQYMNRGGKSTLRTVPLDIVVTHPASWSHEAKAKTLRAITGAFHTGMFQTRRDIFFVSEPEACALYTVQDLLRRDWKTLIPGECFVTCDAGGGTIDLVSYRIDSVEPLVLKQVGGISGGKHGSVFVDHAFLKWLQLRVKSDDIMPNDFRSGGHFVVLPKGVVLLDRFQAVKHTFSGTNQGTLTLPRGTEVFPGHEDTIVNGVVNFTPDIIRGLFKECVTGVVNLISRQVAQVENAANKGIPHQVTHIFLAGGFSENEHLFEEVKKWAHIRPDIDVLRADDCWSGVVSGAVLRGMGIGMDAVAKVEFCPRHYGICLSQTYDGPLYDGPVHWLVRKDDLIPTNDPIMSKFDVRCRFTQGHLDLNERMQILFVASSTDSPSRLFNSRNDQMEITHVNLQLNSIPQRSIWWENNGSNYGTAVISIQLEISKSVRVTLQCGGRSLGVHNIAL